MIKLSISFDKPIQPFGQPAVAAVVKALGEELKPSERTIGVRVTTADQVRQLNQRYSGKDETTDVLSFNYDEQAKAAGVTKEGDVVVSYDHIKSQAKTAGTDEATELALLLLHGILHILGHDHQNQGQQAKLDRLQAKIMRSADLTYRDFGWQHN